MRATISYLGVLLWLPAMVAASSSHPLPGEEDVSGKLVKDTEGTEETAGVEGTGSQSVLIKEDGSVSNDDRNRKIKEWEVLEDVEVHESDMFICYDEPGWFVSSNNHNQAIEPFLNMTCDDLEFTVDESGHEEWCNFHRASAKGGKSAFEACCFCGGGSHVPVPCSDFPNWTLDPSGSNTIIDCKFVAEQQELCSVMKDVIGYGVSTVQEACCACGGGFRPILTDYISIKPLSKDPSQMPSDSPSNLPSSQPSDSPSSQPSRSPSSSPSSQPSNSPSSEPSRFPSSLPSSQPSESPSSEPSRFPSSLPSSQPSESPSSEPSRFPSSLPSSQPSEMPSKSTKSTRKRNRSYPDELDTEAPTVLNSSSPSISTAKQNKRNRLNRQPRDEQINAPSPRRKLLLGDPPFKYPPKFEDDIPSSMYTRQTTETNDNENPAPSPSPNDDETPSPKKVPDIRDWTTRSGLGESPGINNLEFLGLGYDGLRGNPRGSLTSELDPGFRKRVFSLRQDQSLLSVDTAFTVPIGTDFKYISSCKYDSSATEISTFTDYVDALSKEADLSEKSNAASSKSKTKTTNFSLGLNGAFKTSSGKASGSRETSKTKEESKSKSIAFSKSDKTDAFKQQSVEESTISFEARAICSEYEISFHPGAINSVDPVDCNGNIEMPCRTELLDPIFEKALTSLPITFNSGDPGNLEIFEKFFATYGTHYVDRVILGAKRIFTTELSSRATAELLKDSVDISSALSVEMQQAMSSTSSEQWGVSASISKSLKGVTTKKFGREFDVDDGDQNINVNLKLSGEYGLNQGIDGNGNQNDVPKGSDTRRFLREKKSSRHLQQGGSQIQSFHSKESPNKRRLITNPFQKPQGFSGSGSGGQSTTKSNTQSSSSQYDNFARTQKQSEDATKISSKNAKITEVNFGGTPSADWREWAASVKEKPMPISYNLVGLWNLMEDQKAKAFYDAFLYIEGIDEKDLRDPETSSLLSALHFGVSTGTGEPHSSFYSNDPNAEYRALIQLDYIPSVIEDSKEAQSYRVLPLLGTGEHTSTNRVEGDASKAVCGIKTTRLLPRSLIPDCSWQIHDMLSGKDDCEFRESGHPQCTNYAEPLYLTYMRDQDRQGNILDGQESPSSINEALLNGYFFRYYQKLTTSDTERNSSVLKEGNFVELNIQEDEAVCGSGYFMDGIRIRKCIDNDPLCIDDYGRATNNGGRHPYLSSWNNISVCRKKIDWSQLGLTRLPYGGIQGIQISCNRINGLPSERFVQTVFCKDFVPNENFETDDEKKLMTSKCSDESQWEPWNYLPEPSDGSFWKFSGGKADSDNSISYYGINREERFIGVSDFSLFMREDVLPGSGFTADVVTYAMTWRNKDKRPAALFSSSARGHIGENAVEEGELSIENPNTYQKTLSFLDSYPFAISDDISSSGIFAMSKFNRRSSDLNSFTFLAVDDFIKNRDDFIVGVVGNEGRLLNDFNGNSPIKINVAPGIDTTATRKKFVRNFEINLSLPSLSESEINSTTQAPSVSPSPSTVPSNEPSSSPANGVYCPSSDFLLFVFPHWYTNGQGIYPPTPASIAVAVQATDGQATDSVGSTYYVKTGSMDLAFDGSIIARNLGINIFAVKRNLVDENIQVGCEHPGSPSVDAKSVNIARESTNVNMSIDIDELCKYFGIRADESSDESSNTGTGTICTSNSTFPVEVTSTDTSNHIAKKVYFEKDFLSMPSVIVTPIVAYDGETNGCHNMNEPWRFESDDIVLPHCMVETITKEFFVAKCACITYANDSGSIEYEPLAFNYFAVGPVREQKVNDKDFSWTDFIKES